MIRENWDLKGKKAVITGGSKGIGLATAEEMLHLGADVIIISRKEAEQQEALAKLSSIGECMGVLADVSTERGVANVMDEVAEKWDEVDILINNVGTNIRKKTVDVANRDYQTIMDTNLSSAFHLSRSLFPLLKKSGEGSVVFVSSVAGIVHLKTGAVYGMTKAALNQLAKNLAVEWAQYGIRVNSVAPWYTKTPLAMQVLQDDVYRNEVLSRTPLNRIAEAEEVAAAISFLCMPQAGFITGQTLAVDGGFSVYGF